MATLLPQAAMDQLGPQFRCARNFMSHLSNNGLSEWAKRVRAIANGKTLLPASIAPQVRSAVSTGLLEHRKLEVAYKSRSKSELNQFRLHPAGLMSRYSVTYLVASVDGYDDLRQFALHRIREAQVLREFAVLHATFDVDAYVDTGIFSHRQADAEVELIADVHPQIAELLNETPLSAVQRLKDIPGQSWKRLHAQVSLDQNTLWWIFGLNDNIRVHAPQVWVEEIQQKLNNLRTLYSGPNHPPHTGTHIGRPPYFDQ